VAGDDLAAAMHGVDPHPLSLANVREPLARQAGHARPRIEKDVDRPAAGRELDSTGKEAAPSPRGSRGGNAGNVGAARLKRVGQGCARSEP
jgi:hypothetical protein